MALTSMPSASGVPALEARELYRFFRAGGEEILALRGVSLAVAAGEFVAVVGPSGSGKTTLLHCLAGLDEPAGGSVLVAGERLSHRPETERARLRASRIGILLQSGNLLGHLRVRDNVLLARQAAGATARDQPASELLERVGLAGRGDAYPAQLSGGELARAGLAVALANRPDAVLADEPTGELDGESERQVLGLLIQRAREGTALVVVTHSPVVARAADRVLRMSDGRFL